MEGVGAKLASRMLGEFYCPLTVFVKNQSERPMKRTDVCKALLVSLPEVTCRSLICYE